MGYIESNPSSTIREHNRFWFGANTFMVLFCAVGILLTGGPQAIHLFLLIPFVGVNWYFVEDRLHYLRVSRVLYEKTPVPGFWESLTYKGDI